MSTDRSTAATPGTAAPRHWRWLLPVLALPLLAWLLLRWALQPERLGALALERARLASGLELTVAEPARLGIWPGLQLELHGLSARLPGRRPLLQAQRVDVALPLALLWGRELEFGALTLRAPRLDLGELQHWRDRELDAGPPRPPALPRFAASLGIRDGELVYADGSLRGIELEASPLRDAIPFDATLALVVRSDRRELPLRMQLALLPRQQVDGIALEAIRLELGAAGEASVRAAGRALLDAGARIEAALQLQLAEAWPAAWPAAPAQVWPQLAGRTLTLDYRGGLDFDGELELKSDGPEPLQASANPRRLLDWLASDPASPLPPLDAAFELGRIELDGTVIEGLRVELHGAALPAGEVDDEAAGAGAGPSPRADDD